MAIDTTFAVEIRQMSGSERVPGHTIEDPEG
jgi:hypothetical protein